MTSPAQSLAYSLGSILKSGNFALYRINDKYCMWQQLLCNEGGLLGIVGLKSL